MGEEGVGAGLLRRRIETGVEGGAVGAGEADAFALHAHAILLMGYGGLRPAPAGAVPSAK